jgi:hypothetical protein
MGRGWSHCGNASAILSELWNKDGAKLALFTSYNTQIVFPLFISREGQDQARD